MKNNKQIIMLILLLIFFLLSGCFESSNDSSSTGGTPSVPDGPDDIVNIESAASRDSGVAPLSVFFNADLANSTPTTRTFHNYHYEWDFGDGRAGTWGPSGMSQNTDTGPCAAHVYETPGSYTATLTVWGKDVSDNTNSIINTETFNITVDDPNLIFSGNDTICISDTADFTGAPGGSLEITATGDISTLLGTHLTAGKRVLLRRGGSWTMTDRVTSFERSKTPRILGAFGTGVSDDDFGIFTNNPSIAVSGIFSDFGLFDLRDTNDFRIMDLTFTGPTTNHGVFSGHADMRHILFLRLNITGFGTPISWTNWRYSDADNIDGMAIVSCRASGGSSNIIYAGSERISVMGNELKDSGTTHVSRIFWAFKGVYSHNSVSGASLTSGTGRHAIKLHGPNANQIGDFASKGNSFFPEQTRFVVIANNIVGGSGPWPIAIAPTDSAQDERVNDVIVEKNRYAQEYGSQDGLTQAPVYLAARYCTIRNNVFDITGTGTTVRGLTIAHRGVEPAPEGNEIYNNTIYRGADGLTPVNPHVGFTISTDAIDTVIKNNLVSFPFLPASSTLYNDLSADAVKSSNVLTDTPEFIDPGNGDPLRRDFSLKATAIDSIGTGETISVFDDIDEVTRSGGFDLGASAY